MAKLGIIAFIVIVTAYGAHQAASGVEVGSAACKRELQGMRTKMQETLVLLDRAQNASPAGRCHAYSSAAELAGQIRETTARCAEPDERTSAVRADDDVIDAIAKTYEKWCPPRPGMHRIKVTWTKRITRDELPKPLAMVHDCANTSSKLRFSSQRFDLGRLFILGCPGDPNPNSEQIRSRNATAELLRKEQVAIYLTRDSDGDDPRRLTFPILNADGKEAMTDLLFEGRTSIGDKLDLITSNWEPATNGICRVRAVWRVADGQAKLVLWQEATDCAGGANVEFKSILDRQ